MNITCKQLQKLKDPVIILDVREPFELSSGKIPGSINIPIKEVPERLNEIDKDKLIVVYCRSGNRSAYVTKFLIEKGYNAKNLEGGYNEWKKLF
ncbi:MAG: rhodanese-like domain-containing protein [archaeon]